MSRRRKQPLDHPELGLPESRSLCQTVGLFSEHYLKTHIKKNSWWPTDEQAAPLWEFCQQLVNKRARWLRERGNEDDCRQELIDKILTQLGFAWSNNLRLPKGSQDLEPDYILFGSDKGKEETLEKDIQARYAASIGLLEAKKYGHPLSQISRHQQRYPHQQLRQYLDEAQVIPWGILTNGKEWRLYCRDAKPSQFFALDLEVAIQSLEKFKYFVALFSPSAFIRDNNRRCRLDSIRENAIAKQTELEEDLRERVFNLVKFLAHGFVERPENAILDTPDGLRLLYENCLIFLYRLLFILYAEGRSLLPVETDRKYYKDFSLSRLIGPLKSFIAYSSPNRTRLYEDICELCHLINGTDKAKNREYSVPRYNGGLFDPGRYPELEKWRICDAKLVDVLRGLMFSESYRPECELPLETVDYADLRVQQLGSIYEGLLEYHFIRKNDGTLDLVTDKAERKATGTYYTPDYIVKYIVENTVGPLLQKIENSEPVKSAGAAERKDNSFANAVLALNILDPAMGSGHFLVEATTYLADHIVYHPTTRPATEQIVTTGERKRTKEDIIRAGRISVPEGESQEQAEIAYWRRRVVEACIYGVDLNPLAVELAKLSLWLTTIASDQPLNFLDHHLRCGNSLIGARLDQLGKLPARKKRKAEDERQITFTFGPDLKKTVSAAIREIHNIESKASGDVDAVKDKESCWREKILPKLSPYKAIADLWTSAFFGNELDEETYTATAQKILAGQSFGPANDRHYFHWELEFPEVFFDDDGAPKQNPGFDAVIGNPPYANAWAMTGIDDTGRMAIILCSQHQGVMIGHWDLYVPFVSRAVGVLRTGGYQSFIVPDAVAREKYAAELRLLLIRNTTLIRWTHFEGENVFDEVSRHCVIYSLRKGPPVAVHKVIIARPPSLSQSSVVINEVPQADWLVGPANQFRPQIATGPAIALRKRIEKQSVLLGQYCYVMVGATTHSKDKTSFKKADIITQKAVGNAKPFIDGKSFWRYDLAWDGRYIDYRKEEMYGPRVPELFESEKILLRKRTAENETLVAAYDKEGFYCDDTVLALTYYENIEDTRAQTDYPGYEHLPKPYPNLLYTTAVINSGLLTYVFRESFATGTLQGSYSDVYPQQARAFPIFRISFTTPLAERNRQAKRGQEIYATALKKNDPAAVLKFVEQELKANHSDVVHDILAFLAEQMMTINKDKQATAKKFLTDLKDFHGVDVHSLKPKTKLDEFWKLDTTDLFAHLRANVKVLALQNVRLKESDEDKIRDRFQKAKAKIIPLESALSFTDRLIDQIVYRLYDLNDEEIKIVESTSRY